MPRPQDPPLRVGVIGCGEISARYLRDIQASPALILAGCASRSLPRAQAAAAAAGTEAMTVVQMLARAEVDLVLNLTEPLRHAEITSQALLAGKHVYSEKPLAHDLSAGRALLALAQSRGLTLACAPATHLGPAQQTLRAQLDDGFLGPIAGASVSVVYGGPDLWHPHPAPLFGRAAGPLFDLGVYGLSALVCLLGPVVRVMAMGHALQRRRSAKDGTAFDVDCPTHANGLLAFESGPTATFTASFDATGSRAAGLELQGARASIAADAAGRFDAELSICTRPFQWEPLSHQFAGWTEGHWIIGLLDTAEAIARGSPPRASAARALHVLEVMLGLETAIETGLPVDIATRCDRPEPLEIDAYARLVPADQRKLSA